MANATKYIEVLIDSLTKFPGIGRKGAERIAYFIVKSEKSLGKNLINALKEVDEKYGSNVNVSLVVDTEVEKIEDKKEEKVNEDDIVSLFDGKDML